MAKPIIISGIPAGDSGVGRLIEYLISENHNCFEFIFLKKQIINSTRRNYFNRAINKIFNIFYKEYNKIKINALKDKKILLIHPQTIGLRTSINLIKNNKVYYYVMDSSFFCVKSYNHLTKEFNSCLKCIERDFSEANKYGCDPFPVNHKLNKNINFLKNLKKYKNQITFLAQNNNQKKLLKKHFGNINCEIVGLKTSDIENKTKKRLKSKFSDDKIYDLVFHASNHPAKGLLFVLELSKYLKKYSILIPSSIKHINKRYDFNIIKSDYPNVKFEDLRWESGLRNYVLNAKIVLNPSLWSAPIEGALIKSLLSNGMVATLNLPFSFANEIPDNVVLKLDNESIEKSSLLLKELLNDKKKRTKYIINSEKWVHKFVDENKLFKNLKKIISE